MKTQYIAITSILLVFALSCGTSAPITKPSPSSRSVDSDLQERGQRASRLLRCLSAVDQADSFKVWSFFARCLTESKAFSGNKCGEAWAAADNADPSVRVKMIADACGGVYCPKMTSPKPRLCGWSKNQTPSPVAVMMDWTEFHLRILTPALGLETQPALLAKLSVYLVSFPSFAVTNEMEVTLPKSSAASKVPERDLVIAVTRDGRFMLDGQVMKPATLTEALREKHRASPDARILIQADKKASHGAVVSVMDIAKSVGFKRLGVAIQKKD